MNTKNFLLFILLLPFGLSWADEDHLSIHELDDYVVRSSPLQLTESEVTQSWSVLDKAELQLLQSDSIAQTLEGQAGLSQSFYGPQANRPIIRGLDGYRVTVLENGISAFDLSATSSDHAVTVDSLLADSIEILRGSSALLYGCNSIGGVINVFDRSIPVLGTNLSLKNELLTRYSSVDDAWYRGGIVFHQDGNFVLQMHASSHQANDYDVPTFEVHHEEHGDEMVDQVENSHLDSNRFGFGGSYQFDKGFVGLSFSNYESLYGVPNHEKSMLDIEKKKTTLKGSMDLNSGFFDRFQFDLAQGDYVHKELTIEDGAVDIHSNYSYEGIDGRLSFLNNTELNPSALAFHYNDYDFVVDGEESYLAGESGANDAIEKEEGERYALAYMQKYKLSDQTTINGGLRYERWSREYTGTSSRTDSCKNGSIGIVHKKDSVSSISANLYYSERIPETAELYSDGPHHATEAFEIGDPSLRNEQSIGAEISYEHSQGQLKQAVSVYHNDFDNFIYLLDTGTQTPAEPGHEPLDIRRYEGAKANIYGFEYEFDYQLTTNTYVSGFADYIRGKNKTEASDLPRIPPWRIGLGYYTEHEKYRFNLNATYYGTQDDVAGSNEEATDSYTLLNARIGYYIQKDQASELYLKVNNLTDELGYVHTSFLKESAPIPGRNIEVGFSTRF